MNEELRDRLATVEIDICVSKRSEAVRLGAVERSVRDTVVALAQKRENHDG